MPILTRKMKAAGVKDEDVAAHIAEMQAKKPTRKMQETENYIQLEEYKYSDSYTKKNKTFKHIMHEGEKYIPLQSKIFENRTCFWNKRMNAILVYFTYESNWYPYRSIDEICRCNCLGKHLGRPVGGEMKSFYIDVDAYMSGVLDIEFEDNSHDSGDTNIVFNMRHWMHINNPYGTMSMSELDGVVVEHKAACYPSKFQMIVKWT